MKKTTLLLCIASAILLAGCEKFLDKKSNKGLVVPETLQDLQALLNNNNAINYSNPGAGEASSDDYYVTDQHYTALSQGTQKRMYIWAPEDLFEEGEKQNDWLSLYSNIYYANTVFDGLKKITRTSANAATYDDIYGQASFIRASAHFNALQIWSLAYDPVKSKNDLGVVLKESTDFNEKSKRSSAADGYAMVVKDMKNAIAGLSTDKVHATRPNKVAAYALMARIMLCMRNYTEAAKYADLSIKASPDLLDFNTLNPVTRYPITRYNIEVLYHSGVNSMTLLTNSRAKIVPDLYAMYEDNDLRKVLYFRDNKNGTYGWRGSFSGLSGLASSLTTGEMYLIRAECFARTGAGELALADVNMLLGSRYKTGTYKAYTLPDVPDVLALVLQERRKELVLRGLRWMDIKRLNAGGSAITLQRTVNGVTYKLPPNDLRYALPLPEDIIALSGMQRNPR